MPDLISIISAGMTLLPGDIIATGTPPGVGIGFDPPRFLGAGDVIEMSISGLGILVATRSATKRGMPMTTETNTDATGLGGIGPIARSTVREAVRDALRDLIISGGVSARRAASDRTSSPPGST